MLSRLTTMCAGLVDEVRRTMAAEDPDSTAGVDWPALMAEEVRKAPTRRRSSTGSAGSSRGRKSAASHDRCPSRLFVPHMRHHFTSAFHPLPRLLTRLLVPRVHPPWLCSWRKRSLQCMHKLQKHPSQWQHAMQQPARGQLSTTLPAHSYPPSTFACRRPKGQVEQPGVQELLAVQAPVLQAHHDLALAPDRVWSPCYRSWRRTEPLVGWARGWA